MATLLNKNTDLNEALMAIDADAIREKRLDDFAGVRRNGGGSGFGSWSGGGRSGNVDDRAGLAGTAAAVGSLVLASDRGMV